MIGQIKKEPRFDIKDLFAALFVFIGYILLVTIVHILAINTTGGTQEVLNTTFIILLYLLYAFAIFGIVFLLIHWLKWLVWFASTPEWMRKKMRKKTR